MLRIRESQFVGYFADGLPGVEYTLFGYIQHFLLDMLQCRHPGFFLHQVAEIIGRQAELIGALLHSRHSVFSRFVRCKIFVQQILETGQDIVVGILAGNELAVVKADAVIEQQFDIVGN